MYFCRWIIFAPYTINEIRKRKKIIQNLRRILLTGTLTVFFKVNKTCFQRLYFDWSISSISYHGAISPFLLPESILLERVTLLFLHFQFQ